MADLDQAMERYVIAKRALKTLTAELQEAETALLNMMPQPTLYSEQLGCRATRCDSVARVFHPEILKQVLPLRIWRNVRVDAIDTKRMNAYLATGELTVEGLGDGIEIVVRKPYLRLTENPAKQRVA